MGIEKVFICPVSLFAFCLKQFSRLEKAPFHSMTGLFRVRWKLLNTYARLAAYVVWSV